MSYCSISNPILDIEFPTVTICGSGQYLERMKTKLYAKFGAWTKENGDKQKNQTENFKEFMKNMYQLKHGANIMDILSTMLSPQLEASAARALIKHQQDCPAESVAKQRKKRETTSFNGNLCQRHTFSVFLYFVFHSGLLIGGSQPSELFNIDTLSVCALNDQLSTSLQKYGTLGKIDLRLATP